MEINKPDDGIENKLLKDNWLNAQQFVRAKEEQAKKGKSLYSTLIRMGYMSEDDVYAFFSQYAFIPFVRVADYILDDKLVALFSESSYRENLFLPLFKLEDTLYLAMANPLDTNLLSMFEVQSGSQIYALFSTPSAILKAINSYFGPDDKYFNLEDLIISPKALGLMPFWRESERLILNLPIEFKPDDARIKLVSASYISAAIQDISASGQALGVRTFIFIPPQSKISIRFSSFNEAFEAEALVVRCDPQKEGRYFLGVKLISPRQEIVEGILAQAAKPAPGQGDGQDGTDIKQE